MREERRTEADDPALDLWIRADKSCTRDEEMFRLNVLVKMCGARDWEDAL